jgi:hypothetical protein
MNLMSNEDNGPRFNIGETDSFGNEKVALEGALF